MPPASQVQAPGYGKPHHQQYGQGPQHYGGGGYQSGQQQYGSGQQYGNHQQQQGGNDDMEQIKKALPGIFRLLKKLFKGCF